MPLGRARSRQGLPLRTVLFCRWVRSSVGLCRRYAACRQVMPLCSAQQRVAASLCMAMVCRFDAYGLVRMRRSASECDVMPPCLVARWNAASRGPVAEGRLAGLWRDLRCRYAWCGYAATPCTALPCRFALYCFALPLGPVKLWDARPLSTVRAGRAAARSLVRSRTAMPLRRVLVRWAAWSCVGLPLGYVRSRYVKGRRLGVSSGAGDRRFAWFSRGLPPCCLKPSLPGESVRLPGRRRGASGQVLLFGGRFLLGHLDVQGFDVVLAALEALGAA